MIDLGGKVVTTRDLGKVTNYFLIDNTIYSEYYEKVGTFKKKSIKGKMDVTISTKEFEVEYPFDWPNPRPFRVKHHTLDEAVTISTNGQIKSTKDLFLTLGNVLAKEVGDDIGRKIMIDHLDRSTVDHIRAINEEFSAWFQRCEDEANRQVVHTTDDKTIAIICGLIRTSCDKKQITQSFKSVGLDLKLRTDPDHLTGALSFEGEKTLEQLIKDRDLMSQGQQATDETPMS